MEPVLAIIKKLSNKSPGLIASTIYSFTFKGLGATSTLLMSLVVGRNLGASDSGFFFLSFSIITFLAAFSRIGLDNAIVRFIGAEEGVINNYTMSILKKSLFLTLALSFPICLLIYMFNVELATLVFSKPELSNVLMYMSPSIVGISISTIIAMYLQARRMVALSLTFLNILSNISFALITFIGDIDLVETSALIYSAATTSTALVGIFLCFKKAKPSEKKEISWSILLSSCLPLWFVLMMSQLILWFGQIYAGIWLPSDEISQIAVAQRVSMLTSFILMAVNVVVAPRFARLYKLGEIKELEKLAKWSVKIMLLFSVPMFSVLLIFPNYIMSMFGDGFANGKELLQIFCIGQFINVLTGSVAYILTMSGNERDLRNTVAFSGPLIVILCLILVPTFGAYGVAISTSVAIATQNLIAVFWVKKRLGFNTIIFWK